jgi:hypothetical protein
MYFIINMIHQNRKNSTEIIITVSILNPLDICSVHNELFEFLVVIATRNKLVTLI